MFSHRNFFSVERWVLGAALVCGALSMLTSEMHCSRHHPVEVLSTYTGKTLVRSGECGQTVHFTDFQEPPQVNIQNINPNNTYSLILFKENSTGKPYILWKLENIKPYRVQSTFFLTNNPASYNVSIGFTPLMNVTANYTILVVNENGTHIKESEVPHHEPVYASPNSWIQEFIQTKVVVGVSSFRTEAQQSSINPYPNPGQMIPGQKPSPDMTHLPTVNTVRPSISDQANGHAQPTQFYPQINMNPGHPGYTPSPRDVYSTLPPNPPHNPANANPFIPDQSTNHTLPYNGTHPNHGNNQTSNKPHVHGNDKGKPSKGSAGQHQASISIIAFAMLCLAKAFF